MTDATPDNLDRDLTRLHQGRHAEHALSLVDSQLDQQERMVIRRVFAAIESEAGLNPQAAVGAWSELHAIHKLRHSLGRKSRIGQSAAKRLAPHMQDQKPTE